MKLIKSKTYSLKDFSNKEVNLLPNDFHKKAKAKFNKIIMASCIVFAICFMGFYEFTVYQDTQTLKEEAIFKKAVIYANQQSIENQNIIISLGSRIELKEVLLKFIFSTNRSIVDIIETFESTLNGEIYLNSLTTNSSERFVINAAATSHESISYLINQLKLLKTEDDINYFSHVFTSGITRSEDEDGNVLYLFQLDCEFEGGIIDEAQ